IPGRIVIRWLAGRLDDAQMPARGRRLETERQVAVVARAGDERGHAGIDPDIGHAGTAADRAGIDVGRRAVEQYARPSNRIVAGHHAPDRFAIIRHRRLARVGTNASVPIPKFARARGSLHPNFGIKGTPANFTILVPLLNPKFANTLTARSSELRVRGTSSVRSALSGGAHRLS